MFLVPKLDAVSIWGLMSAEVSWLFLLLQPSMLLVFAAVSFLRSSWPVVLTTVPALEEWQSCWDIELCLHGCLNKTPVLCLESLSVSQQPGEKKSIEEPWGGKDFFSLLMVWAPTGRGTEPRQMT